MTPTRNIDGGAEGAPELREWMTLWQAGDPAPAGAREAILHKVKRQSLYQRLWAAAEAAVSLAMAAFLVAVGVRSSHPADGSVVALFLLLLLATVIWGYRARRGLWRPGGQSAADFLDLSLRRCRQRLRMVTAGYVLLAAEVGVFVPWLWVRGAQEAWAFLAVMAAAAVAALELVRRRTVRDLEVLREMGRSLEGNGG